MYSELYIPSEGTESQQVSISKYFYHMILDRETEIFDLDTLGAVEVPRVCGRWPGNLDIVLGFIKSLRNDYPMQFMSDIFEQYDSRTLNLRMLWEDQVRRSCCINSDPHKARLRLQIWTIDDGHVKSMLTDPGFEWYHKGYYWQERL